MDNDNLLKKKLTSYYKNMKFKFDYRNRVVYSEEEGNKLIFEALSNESPCMISRFGATELNCINFYIKKKKYTEEIKDRIKKLSGVFPNNDKNIDSFCSFYLECSKSIDILGIWCVKGERYCIDNYCNNPKLVKLRSIEPYYFNNPWSRALENKKVLVIHPFMESIIKQYEKRNMIFEDKSILPKFKSLKVIKAVQSIADNDTEFGDWFDAYNYMCNEIDKIDFDIAIVGAGSYGLPLSSYIKEKGKKVIHMAGATQILFGIKGKRWDDHKYISNLYNENWIRPNSEETPINSNKVEGGSYW